MSDESKAIYLNHLALHYPRPRMTEEEQAVWLSDYLRDLSDYSSEMVAQACEQWRRSDQTRFPTIGQLRAILEPVFKRRQTPVNGNREWSPAPDLEFQMMTRWQKARELRLRAGLERQRANAHKDWSLERRAQPEGYVTHIRRAENLEAEADAILNLGGGNKDWVSDQMQTFRHARPAYATPQVRPFSGYATEVNDAGVSVAMYEALEKRFP